MQARSNVRALQQLADDPNVHPTFHPTTNFRRGERRSRTSSPPNAPSVAQQTAISAELDFDEFLARQARHAVNQEAHARHQRRLEEQEIRKSPKISKGSLRILASTTRHQTLPAVRCLQDAMHACGESRCRVGLYVEPTNEI
jgi:hypothetical protein